MKTTDEMELRYCGMLGHTVVILTDGHGKMETCDLASARRYVAEQAGHNPRIYKRTKSGTWKAVR